MLTRITKSIAATIVILVAGLTMASAVCAGEQLVQLTKGGTVFNADFVSGDSRGSKQRVALILHGTLGHKDMALIETLQEAFGESGWDSLAINLSLGVTDRTGSYSCATPHMHRSEDAIWELENWADWLSARGYGDITVVGHSRGASQATKFALTRPEKIGQVVLLAPPTEAAKADPDIIEKIERTDGEAWLQNTDFLYCKQSTVSIDSYLSYYGPDSATDTVTLTGGLAVPALVIAASEDNVVTDLADKMRALTNSKVVFREIEGADHFFRDLYAYDVVDTIIEYDNTQPAALIEMATSLAEVSQEARGAGLPIVVFVSQTGCEYCYSLRQKILVPMIRAGELEGRVILREVLLDHDFELQGFDGETVTGPTFAARYGVSVTPTLLFLDYAGRVIHDPIVGTQNLEMYGFYLDRAIIAAGVSPDERL